MALLRGGSGYVLIIDVDEKWTTIPVVRGQFGGGTPLRVAGLYDIHSFGRLWTLGAEGRKYGDAPWGGVAWARHPRFLQGQHVHGFEVWRQFRLRTVYDEEDQPLGRIRSDWTKYRLLFMWPANVAFSNLKTWKLGVDGSYRIEAPSTYEIDEDASSLEFPKGIDLNNEPTKQTAILLRSVFDDVVINNLTMDGFRFNCGCRPFV